MFKKTVIALVLCAAGGVAAMPETASARSGYDNNAVAWSQESNNRCKAYGYYTALKNRAYNAYYYAYYARYYNSRSYWSNAQYWSYWAHDFQSRYGTSSYVKQGTYNANWYCYRAYYYYAY